MFHRRLSICFSASLSTSCQNFLRELSLSEAVTSSTRRRPSATSPEAQREHDLLLLQSTSIHNNNNNNEMMKKTSSDPYQNFLVRLPPPSYLLRFAALGDLMERRHRASSSAAAERWALCQQTAYELLWFQTRSRFGALRFLDSRLGRLMLEESAAQAKKQQEEKRTRTATNASGDQKHLQQQQQQPLFSPSEIDPIAESFLFSSSAQHHQQETQQQKPQEEAQQQQEEDEQEQDEIAAVSVADLKKMAKIVSNFFSSGETSDSIARETLQRALALTAPTTASADEIADIFSAYAVVAADEMRRSGDAALPFEFSSEVESAAYVVARRFSSLLVAVTSLAKIEQCALSAAFLQLYENSALWDAIAAQFFHFSATRGGAESNEEQVAGENRGAEASSSAAGAPEENEYFKAAFAQTQTFDVDEVDEELDGEDMAAATAERAGGAAATRPHRSNDAVAAEQAQRATRGILFALHKRVTVLEQKQAALSGVGSEPPLSLVRALRHGRALYQAVEKKVIEQRQREALHL